MHSPAPYLPARRRSVSSPSGIRRARTSPMNSRSHAIPIFGAPCPSQPLAKRRSFAVRAAIAATHAGAEAASTTGTGHDGPSSAAVRRAASSPAPGRASSTSARGRTPDSAATPASMAGGRAAWSSVRSASTPWCRPPTRRSTSPSGRVATVSYAATPHPARRSWRAEHCAKTRKAIR